MPPGPPFFWLQAQVQCTRHSPLRDPDYHHPGISNGLLIAGSKPLASCLHFGRTWSSPLKRAEAGQKEKGLPHIAQHPFAPWQGWPMTATLSRALTNRTHSLIKGLNMAWQSTSSSQIASHTWAGFFTSCFTENTDLTKRVNEGRWCFFSSRKT